MIDLGSFLFQWFEPHLGRHRPSLEARPADGIAIVFVVLLLPLPYALTCRFGVELVGILHDGVCAMLNGHGLPNVNVLYVRDFQDEAGQSAELPRPALDGNIGGKPRHEVAATETARGLLAAVAEDG